MSLYIGIRIAVTSSTSEGGGPPLPKNYLLTENSDFVLTESGDKIILEDS